MLFICIMCLICCILCVITDYILSNNIKKIMFDLECLKDFKDMPFLDISDIKGSDLK